jgi:hypothetical protein
MLIIQQESPMEMAELSSDRAGTSRMKEPLIVKMSHTVEVLVTVLLRRSVPKLRNVFEGKCITVPAATGSVKSIIVWAREGLGGDRMQARAFEVIISSFVLTFSKDAMDNDDVLTQLRT